jgi:membrane-bound lytic murein transglycosylase MltF
VELNRRLVAAGKPAITLTPVPDALEDEDLMDMLGAGLLELIVVDDWRARGWAQVVPALKVHDDLVVKARGHAGWAHRKDSPKLAAALAEYYRSWAKKRELAGHRQAEYLKRLKPLMNPAGPAEWARFEQTLALFEKYGQQHGFDPLLLAAQGFQESQLDPSARGPRGAVGLMQLMPATGAEMQVGDITTADANIHAAAKYMDRQMARSFADVKFTENNRTLFAIAAYHAGPGNIAKLRKEAQRRGFDPDRWFDNMEVIAAERIGVDTTTYVRNIYKYYVGYTLQSALDETRRKAREQVRAGRN